MIGDSVFLITKTNSTGLVLVATTIRSQLTTTTKRMMGTEVVITRWQILSQVLLMIQSLIKS